MDIAAAVRKRPMLLGSLLLSVASALMLLLDDFAVWSETHRYSEYGFYESEAGWVYITEGPPYVLLFLVLAGLLIFAAWTSVRGLLSGDKPVAPATLRWGMWAAVAESLLSFLTGMIFLIVMAAGDQAYDWWLDTGFYGGFLLGGLAALLLFLQSRAERRAHPAAPLRAHSPVQAPPRTYAPRPHPKPATPPAEPSHARVCPACSAPARETDKFCQRCGTRLPPQ